MTRGIGELHLLQSILPEYLVLSFLVPTMFGETWLLGTVLAGVYWFGVRRRGATLLGVAFGGMTLVITLKATFALGRPPGAPAVDPLTLPALVRPLYLRLADAAGYGFPSGHALDSTVVWGSLALWLDGRWIDRRSRRRRRVAAASVLVALVCVSRVVLGVHYLVDVVAGVAVGLTYLAAIDALRRRGRFDPTTTFALAAGLAVIAVVATGASTDSALALGAALGGLVAWRRVEAEVPQRGWPTTRGPLLRGTALAGCVGVAAGACAVVLSVAGVPRSAVAFVVGAVAVAALVGLPSVAAVDRRVAKKRERPQNFSR